MSSQLVVERFQIQEIDSDNELSSTDSNHNLISNSSLDDDEEILERFDDNHISTTISMKNKENNEKKKSTNNKLLDAMSRVVQKIEENSDLQNIPTNSKITTISSLPQAANNDGDVFGVAYKPFFKASSNIVTSNFEAIDEDELKTMSMTGQTQDLESMDEFEFDKIEEVAGSSISNIVKQIGTMNYESKDGISHDSSILENTNHKNQENHEVIAEVSFDLQKSTMQAFELLKAKYSVVQEIEPPAAAVKNTLQLSDDVNKCLIRETILEVDENEEEADDEELSSSVKHNLDIFEDFNPELDKQKLIEEWDNLLYESPNPSIILQDIPSMTYKKCLSYLQKLDLSQFEGLIVTTEDVKASISWMLPSSKTALKINNPEVSLKFPFLVAQLDYDPNIPEHFGCLRYIFESLVGVEASCPVSGSHWEKIGFQGNNPYSDLNRSMKFFTILQTLHLLDFEATFCRRLHRISGSMNATNRENSSLSDMSWPFMCVSIMFTKETIQALRSGLLNYKCNKRGDILTVCHEFHHACFYVFAKLLLSKPKTYHAEHLQTIRDLCKKNPIQVYNAYRQVIKSRKNADEDILSLSHQKNDKSNTINFDKLNNLDDMQQYLEKNIS